MRELAKPVVQKGHISEVEISDGSDDEENNSNYEEEHINGDDDKREEEEEITISNIVDLKQIPGKFSKWLVESLDPYFKLPVYLTLGVPIRGRQIVEVSESSIDEEYESSMLQKTGESFKRNSIIYLNCYYNKSFLKNVKDVNQITSLNWCQFILDKLICSVRHYKESKAGKGVYFDRPLFFLIVPIQQAIPS
ncbi:LOW QUALITY PROTEIN: hypothetical protein Cgig2_013834 [Carnegiea gigantea]|uniref:Uncharacterized protein n=1 Tax=Carnegiea gigantea TaxID=171969 RepID=A0A9Q1Q8Y6_9CARY|nr:LOW QUALITY PROTEIN: hypothetical protein Cgig2_013834 [Carnegiea gigantea]